MQMIKWYITKDSSWLSHGVYAYKVLSIIKQQPDQD